MTSLRSMTCGFAVDDDACGAMTLIMRPQGVSLKAAGRGHAPQAQSFVVAHQSTEPPTWK